VRGAQQLVDEILHALHITEGAGYGFGVLGLVRVDGCDDQPVKLSPL
jgi:hypothetical protein